MFNFAKLNDKTMKVQIINKSKHSLPQYATSSSAGMDLRANLDNPIVLKPLQRCLVPTGLYIALPEGFEAQIRPRSGLALKKGITLLNTPGTIDADYRGEIGVIVINLSAEDFIIEDGERIGSQNTRKGIGKTDRFWNGCRQGHINRHFNLCNRTFHHQADKRVGSQNTRKAED